jgi:prepilin-type N-terminal cleavage/methylation domain-containing protein
MKKGFTLIELLVVIAIIGILATIVVVNVNSARNKAYDVNIKAGLDQVRQQMELWYDGNGASGYSGIIATTTDAAKGVDMATIYSAIINNGGSGYSVYGSTTVYCAKVSLKSGGTWCVDSSGYAGASSTNCTSIGRICQ